MALEEGGKAARTFMEAMKAEPLALALVVTNLAMIGYLYFAGAQRHQEMQLLYENRKEVHQMLFHCLPPSERKNEKLE